ncbi:MAG: RNA polymerase factor sigma-32 [Bdellovibrionaceae bacterium]|nr:RNA polymerase factor sigma-32 [Pseudobdellovibrionaceae bacterium]
MAKSKSSATPRKGTKKSAPVETRPVVAEIVEDHEDLPFQPDVPSTEGKVIRVEPEIVEDDPEGDRGPESSSATLPVPAGEKGLTSTDPLTLYLNEVRRYPLLSREEELKLAKRYYESKDPEAAQALVKANLRFVIKVAAEYSKFGARLIDLIQEGNVGLMHAVKEYNPYKGARLITYAVWWIRGYIQEYLMRQYSMVRIGTTQNQRKLFYQLQKKKEELEALGDNPDFAKLSATLGIPEDEIRDMALRLKGRDVSLDRPVDDDSSTRLTDLQKDDSEQPLDERLAHAEQLSLLKEKIDEIRPSLNERELILLDERILADEPLTLQEIGEKYKITREAVRQAEARLLKKIREKMTP